MKKQVFQIRLLAVLFLTVLVFFSCEQEEIIQEARELSNEQFFLTDENFSDFENTLLKNAEKVVPDSVENKWLSVYGKPHYKNAELLTDEDNNLLLIPLLKQKNEYSGLLVIFKNEYKVFVKLFTNEIILKNENHPMFIRYARMQKEIGNIDFQKYRFEIMDIQTRNAVATWSYNCIKVYFEIEFEGEKLEFSKWQCKDSIIVICVGGGEGEHVDDVDENLWEGGNYYRGSGGGGGGEDLPDPTPEVDDKEITGTKVYSVKKKLEKGGNTSLINKLLKGFELSNSNLDVIFQIENLGDSINGKTIHNPNTGKISIIINSQTMNRSSLELARTILHECLHAHIFAKLYQGELHNSLPEPNFERDFKEYDKIFGEKQSQHNYMADKYREHMKEGLRKYFQNESYYQKTITYLKGNNYWVDEDFMLECLTWTGLKKTKAWKNFIKNTENKKKYDEQYQFIISQLPKEK